jgi:O-antigen/teichoic acid export membrane protein
LLTQENLEQQMQIAPGSTKMNAVANAASFFVTVVLAFFVTPLIIRGIGDARYGVLAVAGELIGYYGLLDLGVRTAVSYYVARLVAERRDSDLQELLRTAFWNLCALAAGVLVLVVLAVWQLPVLIRIDHVPLAEARLAVGISLTAFAFTLPFSVPNAIFIGFRRFDVANACVIGSNIVSAVATIIALRAGAGLVTVATIQASRVVLVWAGQVYCLHRLGFRTRLWPPTFLSSYTKRLYTYGSATFVINIAVLVGFSVDLLIISRVLGLADVSRFHIGRYLGMHLGSLIGTVSATLATVFTHRATTGDTNGARHLYMQASRVLGALTLLTGSGILVFGGSFLRLWMGEKYITGYWWNRSDVVLMFMTIATMIGCLSVVSYQYVLGTGRLGFLTRTTVVQALANLVGSIGASFLLGAAGIALSRMVVTVAASVILISYCLKLLDIERAVYFNRIVAPIIPVGVTTAAVGIVCVSVRQPTSWIMLLAEAVLAGGVGATALWLFALDGEQRLEYLGKARALAARTGL